MMQHRCNLCFPDAINWQKLEIMSKNRTVARCQLGSYLFLFVFLSVSICVSICFYFCFYLFLFVFLSVFICVSICFYLCFYLFLFVFLSLFICVSIYNQFAKAGTPVKGSGSCQAQLKNIYNHTKPEG